MQAHMQCKNNYEHYLSASRMRLHAAASFDVCFVPADLLFVEFCLREEQLVDTPKAPSPTQRF